MRDAVLGERPAATGWIDAGYLRHLVDAHPAGTRDYSSPLWTLLMFEAFLKNVVAEGARPVGADLGAGNERDRELVGV